MSHTQKNYVPPGARRVQQKQPDIANMMDFPSLCVSSSSSNSNSDNAKAKVVFYPKKITFVKKVADMAEKVKAKEAEEAGADFVGGDDLAKKIEEGFADFDVVIATPDLMPVVGRLGKVLGPSGKMPNPKVGTVTMDVAKAVTESKAGKVEYRTDKTGIVHVVVGRVGFPDSDLVENLNAVLDEIHRAKPSAAKGRYIHSVTIASTMGPGVKISTDAGEAAPVAKAAPAAEAPVADAPAEEAVVEEVVVEEPVAEETVEGTVEEVVEDTPVAEEPTEEG
jgi:large subunit ribosomal protein L1